MSDDAHDIQKHIRGYLIIGGILMIGTILTVWVSGIDFGAHWLNVAVGLLIATAKASLVALYFMHLISEKTTIYLVLGFTVFFFIGMMGLTLWSAGDMPTINVP